MAYMFNDDKSKSNIVSLLKMADSSKTFTLEAGGTEWLPVDLTGINGLSVTGIKELWVGGSASYVNLLGYSMSYGVRDGVPFTQVEAYVKNTSTEDKSISVHVVIAYIDN